MGNITIGIEGLVGSGKTSLCRELLDMIPNSIILHGGNLYRGIVVALMNYGIDLKAMISGNAINTENEQVKNLDIKQIMDMLKVEIKIENRESVVYVAGKKIEEDTLQSDKASMAVSNVALKADNTRLYSFARDLINTLKQQYNIIISGRDLMKIYPDLDYHFFITATIEARVNRKSNQYKATCINKDELREHIMKRDELQEKAGYYEIYPNTIKVDVTDCVSANESAKKCLENIKIA